MVYPIVTNTLLKYFYLVSTSVPLSKPSLDSFLRMVHHASLWLCCLLDLVIWNHVGPALAYSSNHREPCIPPKEKIKIKSGQLNFTWVVPPKNYDKKENTTHPYGPAPFTLHPQNSESNIIIIPQSGYINVPQNWPTEHHLSRPPFCKKKL